MRTGGSEPLSLYYRPVRPSPLELKHRIDEIYTAYPFYGSRRMTITLQQEGHAINRDVGGSKRLMLEGIQPGDQGYLQS